MEKTDEIILEKRKLKALPFCYANILLIPIGIGIIILCKMFPAVAEFYAVNIYPSLMNIILTITNFIPFSLVEVTIIFAPIFIIIYFVNKVMYAEKNDKKNIIKKFVGWIVSWISVIFIGLVLLEGINYHRISFAEYTDLPVEKSTKYELYGLCKELADNANTLRYRVSEDDMGVSKLFSDDIYQVAEKSYQAYEKLAVKYPILGGNKIRPKPLICSKFMSFTEITGIFSPLTMEANINSDVTVYSLPSTMCHEMSHIRGIMREDEANFISYLACMESDDSSIQYSGTMLALVYSMNQLYSEDYDLFLEVYADYSDGIKRDFDAYSNYWKKFEGPIAEVSNRVNDTYLKLNNQTDGVKSYGRMVDLLLAERRQRRS